MKHRSIRQLMLTSMLLAVLVVQELALSSIPNVQLTFVLLLVYAAVLPGYQLGILVLAYVFLDNLIFGSLNFFIVVPMLIAWTLYVFLGRLLRNRSIIVILVFVTIFSFFYGWIFIPFAYFQFYQGVPGAIKALIVADIPFDLILAVNGYFTTLALYRPLVGLITTFQSTRNQDWRP
ncbi:MAG: hypothetical protein WC351_01955 [Candidatus Izemoplasmatales bacterium]|jgi:hypothetical protein